MVSDRYAKSREFFQQAFKWIPPMQWAYAGLADSYTAASVRGGKRPRNHAGSGSCGKGKRWNWTIRWRKHITRWPRFKLFYRWDWEGAEKESGQSARAESEPG